MLYGYGLVNNHVPTLRATVMGANGGGASITDTDVLAFISAASITTSSQKSAINTLVLDLKTASIWTKMKAIYPFVGGTASQHRFNLKDPRALDAAYYLTFYNGWTHSANGALPSGTDGYADTKLNPNTALTSMNQHISYYSRTNSTSNVNDNGCQDDLTTGTGKNIFAFWGASYLNYYMIQTLDANTLSSSDTSSLGLILASRTSSTLLEGHRNGVKKTQSTTPTTSGKPNINVYLGALNYRNGAGTISTYYGVRETAFASIGDGLTSAEASSFYTAIQKFQTTLNRNV